MEKDFRKEKMLDLFNEIHNFSTESGIEPEDAKWLYTNSVLDSINYSLIKLRQHIEK